MKGIKEFLEVMKTNKVLEDKVRNSKDIKEIIKIANEEGYSVTEAEANEMFLDTVSGGWTFNLGGLIQFGDKNKYE